MIETPETSFDHFLDPTAAALVLRAVMNLLPPGYTLGVDKTSIFFAQGVGTDRISYILFDEHSTYPTQAAVLDLIQWIANAAYLAGYVQGKVFAPSADQT